MLAEIIIDELKANCIIGYTQNERTSKQTVLLSLAIQYDISQAIETDNINNGLNYESLTNTLKTTIENSRYHLIESLANKVINVTFTYSEIKQVSLFLYKSDSKSLTKRVGIKLVKENKKASPILNNTKLSWD